MKGLLAAQRVIYCLIVAGRAFYGCTLLGANHWFGLLDVRYAPIATKFCVAAKSRDGPIAEVVPFAALGPV